MVSKSTSEASQRLVLNKDNCNSIFRIPSHLVKSYGEELPSKVTLRVDDSVKKWKVSIEKFKDHYFFTNGWKDFAEQVDLKSLNYLKFKYGKDKKKRSGDVKATSSILNEDKGESSGAEEKLSFCKEMKKHHRYSLDIPKRFAMGIVFDKNKEIKLKGDEGREWPVRVVERDIGNFSLCGGWCVFVIDNKLMIGSKISFTWLSGNMVQTQIVDVGTDKQPLFSTANRREKRL